MKMKDTGFSLIEVIIGSTILAITTMYLYRALTVGDKIYARGTHLGSITMLAWNAAEKCKYTALKGANVKDTSYEENVDGRVYQVMIAPYRKNLFEVKQNGKMQEIEIKIRHVSLKDSSICFRLVQNYYP